MSQFATFHCVFAVSQYTHLGISSIQRANTILGFKPFIIHDFTVCLNNHLAMSSLQRANTILGYKSFIIYNKRFVSRNQKFYFPNCSLIHVVLQDSSACTLKE